MARAPTIKTPGQPIFGPPATTPEEAFIRFGNAMHWEAYVLSGNLHEELGHRRDDSPDALLTATLNRLPRSEHRLVAECITALTGGGYAFTEAQAIWKKSENDTMRISWEDPDLFLRFLLYVRDRIDPYVWPASRPRFRAG